MKDGFFRKCLRCGGDIFFNSYAHVFWPNSQYEMKIPFCPKCEYGGK